MSAGRWKDRVRSEGMLSLDMKSVNSWTNYSADHHHGPEPRCQETDCPRA